MAANSDTRSDSAPQARAAGPWTTDGLCIFADHPRRWIASVACDKTDDIAERRANILAMTAADDLLREIERADGVLWMAERWMELKGESAMNAHDFRGRITALRVVIAKAKGV